MNLQKSVSSLQESLQIEDNEAAGYIDIKLELVMPRIIASSRQSSAHHHPWRPSSLLISASKVSLSNYRSLESGCRADLANSLDKFQQSPMFFGGSFPSSSSDPGIVTEKFWSHATGSDNVRDPPAPNMSPAAMFKKDLLWTDARDVWHCSGIVIIFVSPRRDSRQIRPRCSAKCSLMTRTSTLNTSLSPRILLVS